MKILITTDAYHPMTNGVVISIDILYKQLKKLGYDVKILSLSADGRERIVGDIFYFSSYNVNIYPNAKVIKPTKNKIIREIIKWSPDIIHSQSEFSTMIIAKYIKRKLGIPQVHTYHTMYEEYLHYFLGGKILGKKALSKIIRVLLNTFDTVVAPTEKVQESLKNYKVATNIEIIPTGINLKRFQSSLSRNERDEILSNYNLKLTDNVIIYVGRIAEEKNIEEIISFYNKGISHLKNTKLLIVGGGPYLSKLQDLVREYEIEEYVKFTGMIPSEEIHKYYKLGDVFVTASTSETQGITYIEALASGVPVLCRWDMCIKDLVIDEKTGFTYKNEDEFTNKLTKLIQDEEIKKEMALEIKYKVQDYSDIVFGERISNLYEELVEAKKDYYLTKLIHN
ncbi:glycosyltransferase family 4 protein [Clostridium cellulovorans]|uniref:Glycosyl transferase group 1 n=2 Tax=Clostridium cellulovorans TaxID=1493 RepID=D9SQY4_CLOC7|nr:glycosyltransferase family 4 protein [Clostridium cellulovorans]ADL50272.1 glycosyl transferase group 1 [Clostridium cellulovorans 743B]BAV13185.1 glycosyltransferase [Clostridium cellulovorans]